MRPDDDDSWNRPGPGAALYAVMIVAGILIAFALLIAWAALARAGGLA